MIGISSDLSFASFANVPPFLPKNHPNLNISKNKPEADLCSRDDISNRVYQYIYAKFVIMKHDHWGSGINIFVTFIAGLIRTAIVPVKLHRKLTNHYKKNFTEELLNDKQLSTETLSEELRLVALKIYGLENLQRVNFIWTWQFRCSWFPKPKIEMEFFQLKCHINV